MKIQLSALIAAFAIAAAAHAQTATTTAGTPPPPPPACTAPEHRQFDFWVGHWDVFDPKSGKTVGESLIEKVYHGCGIRENWQPRKDQGGSLNIYLPAQKQWFQTWIDAQGSRGEFVGGWNGKAMVIEGDWPAPADPAKPNRVRMTYTPNPDGSVLQEGISSADGGKTWKPSFAFLYRHHADPPAP